MLINHYGKKGMKILSLELHGYHRFSLNGIKTFKITMTEMIQIIIGRNGSGKSSLLKELSPLPAEKSNYTKDGYKKIAILKDGKHYLLTSTFNPLHHSFLVDGEELNPGGTQSVQKELVRTIFNITQDTLNVITGLELFTNMSPSRRRELFTTMCDTDYEYAIKVYNRIKESYRDTQGAIKIAKKRLSSLIIDDLGAEQVNILRKELNDLTDESKRLYQLKVSNTPTTDEALNELNALKTRLVETAKKFKDLRNNFIKDSALNYFTASELEEDKQITIYSIERTKGLLAQLNKQYTELQESIGDNALITDDEYKSMSHELLMLNSEITELKKEITIPLELNHAVTAHDMIQDMYQEFNAICHELPINDGWYSDEIRETNLRKLSELNLKLNRYTNTVDKLKNKEEHLTHLLEGESTTCPDCKHTFKVGYDSKVHEELKLNIQKGIEHIENIEAEIRKLTKLLEELNNYHQIFTRFKLLTNQYKNLPGFWGNLVTPELLKENPKSLIAILNQYFFQVKKLMIIKEKNDRVLELKTRLEAVNKAKSTTLEADKKRLSKLEEYINFHTTAIKTQNDYLSHTNERINRLKQIEDTFDLIMQLKAGIHDSTIEVANAYLNDIIDKSLLTVHQRISDITNRLFKAETQSKLLKEVESNISNLEKEEKAFKLLIDSFSPTDGLIAEGLLGFIRSFIRTVNYSIAQLWSYKINIRDCSTVDDGVDLNFKFPLEVEGDTHYRDDVKDGSSGMREVINLAFRLVAMQKMGLHDYPLMLDEFGAFFDAEHKQRAPQAIKTIIEQLNFSQVFIISHHEMEYSSFNQSEICVLDKTNTVISSNMLYNNHVEMS